MMRHAGTFLFFILLAQAVGITTGLLFQPGEWYAALDKPFFNPPNWIFGPVWTVLYVLIGIAGAQAWRWDPQSRAIKLWFVQMGLNGSWTVVFFGLQMPGIALIIIALLIATILLFIRATWKEVRTASWMFVPYLAWVSFASLLNAALFYLN